MPPSSASLSSEQDAVDAVAPAAPGRRPCRPDRLPRSPPPRPPRSRRGLPAGRGRAPRFPGQEATPRDRCSRSPGSVPAGRASAGAARPGPRAGIGAAHGVADLARGHPLAVAHDAPVLGVARDQRRVLVRADHRLPHRGHANRLALAARGGAATPTPTGRGRAPRCPSRRRDRSSGSRPGTGSARPHRSGPGSRWTRWRPCRPA